MSNTYGINKNRIKLLFAAMLYVFVMSVIYIYIISPRFTYVGMVSIDLPVGIYLMQYSLSFLPIFWMPIELTKPSQFQVWILYIVVLVPANVIGYHIVAPELHLQYFLYLLVATIGFVGMIFVSSWPYMRIPKITFNKLYSWILVVTITVATYVLLFGYFGVPESFLGMGKIYQLRGIVKDKMVELPALVRYMIWWQGIFFNPLFLVIGLIRRNYFLIIVSIILQGLLYSITSLRTFMVSVVFVIFVWFLMFKTKSRKGLIFIYLITIIAAILSVSTFVLDRPFTLIAYIFLQRWLCSPGQLTGAYFDFFSQNDFAFFGYSLLNGIISYPYGNLTPAEVIGDTYLTYGGKIVANASAHIWAEGFANFGYPGVVAASLLGAVTLWLVDSVYRDVDARSRVLLFSTVSLSFAGQGLLTSYLTGGMLPLLLFGVIAGNMLGFADRASKPGPEGANDSKTL